MSRLPEGWVETTLGDVAEISSSKRIFAKEYRTSGIPFFRGKEITEQFNGNKVSTELFISEEKYNEIKKDFGVPTENDILLTSVGTLGNPWIVEKDLKFYFKDGNLTWFRDYKNIFPKFLYHWLISNSGKEGLSHAVIGSTQKAYTIAGLKKVEINLPPLPEQKAIAAVLSAFDDKIELLREQNRTLETLAQAIFKEWFVHFNFPDKDGKPYRDNGGEMVESELGEIPKGWKAGKLKEITEKISKGTTPRKKEVEGLPVQVPFLKVKDISDGGLIKMDSLEQIPIVVHNGALNRSILKTNDILFSIAGTIGRVAIVPDNLNDANCNQAIAFIRLRSKNVFLEYAHQWLKSSEVQYEIKSSIVQGVQANVSLTVLGNLKLTIPNNEIMNKWNEIIKPIYGKIKNNTAQIQTLFKTRDTLLPKLMSGEIRVKGFEQ